MFKANEKQPENLVSSTGNTEWACVEMRMMTVLSLLIVSTALVVTSKPLHRQLLMTRNPLSVAYSNKQTVKSSSFCWKNGEMGSGVWRKRGPNPSAVPSCPGQPGLLCFHCSFFVHVELFTHQYTEGHNFLTCPVDFPMGFTSSLLLVISFPCVWDEVRAWPFQSLGNGPPALGCWRRTGESAWECYPNTLARMRALTHMFIQRQRDGPAAKIKCWQHFIFHS